MGKTTRDYLKRKVAQAWYSCERSLATIQDLHELFETPHPDLADGLVAAAGLIISSQVILESFAWSCWEIDKDTLLTYRQN